MANRTVHSEYGSLDRNVVVVYAHMNVGATGAITAQDCNGVTLSRTGVGAYRLTLADVYPQSAANYVSAGTLTSPLLFVDFIVLDAGTRIAPTMTIISQTVHTDGIINIQFDSAANTPVELNSGCTVRFAIHLKNSTTPRKGS